MNKVILIGNLANDPELRTTQSGISNCTFRLAVQRKYANQQGQREADFLNIVCWRQTAELCARYLAKGRKVGIEGTLQTRSYDAQDGSKRYVTEVIAESVEFLSARDDGANNGGNNTNQKRAQQNAPAQQAPTNHDDFQEVDDDDLPF